MNELSNETIIQAIIDYLENMLNVPFSTHCLFLYFFLTDKAAHGNVLYFHTKLVKHIL